jgi:Flp pilus assembly pilin Flp
VSFTSFVSSTPIVTALIVLLVIGMAKIAMHHMAVRRRKRYDRHFASPMRERLTDGWRDQAGQSITEYAVMLAVLPVVVIGAIHIAGFSTKTIFSAVNSLLK